MQKKEVRYGLYVQLALIYFWCTALMGSDSFYSLYLLCAVGAAGCAVDNDRRKNPVSKETRRALYGASALFSLSVVLANYALFQPYAVLMNLLNLGLSLSGGFVVARNVLLWALMHVPAACEKRQYRHPAWFFAAAFFLMCAINLTYLLLCKYPGVAPYDTRAQMNQALGLAPVSNWTPYWHTMAIRFFYKIGFSLFGEVNAAVAFFSGCQAVFASACFAYVLVTLYQLGLPKWSIAAAFCLYALLPYNIVFSITIGKDVLFGLGLLLMLTAFSRVLLGVGRSGFLNGFFLGAGGLGFCLWRTNGWPIYLLFLLLSAAYLWKHHRRYLMVMVAVAVSGWYLLNPYLQARGVENGSITETMSVPFQQIARVVVNDRELTEEEESMLSEIFRLDQVEELYDPIRVDPIKFDAFRYSHLDYFQENLPAYGKLWLKLGLKYPGDYLEAWVDQTKGFWHGGYDMGVYDKAFPDNDLGIENRSEDNLAAKAFGQYFRLFERPAGLECFKSIGFAVWLLLACVFVNAVRGQKHWLIALPVLLLLVFFWLGVPVYAEFRYAYPVFITSPLILFITVAEPKG